MDTKLMRFFLGKEIFFLHRSDKGVYWSRGTLKDISPDSFMISYKGKRQIYNSEDTLQVREKEPNLSPDPRENDKMYS